MNIWWKLAKQREKLYYAGSEDTLKIIREAYDEAFTNIYFKAATAIK